MRRHALSWMLLSLAVMIGSASAQLSEPQGTYRFIRDSDGASSDEGSSVILTFLAGGLSFAAIGPGQNVTDQGTYSFNGNLVTISLPGLGKSAVNQPYTLTLNTLKLPFKVFSGGPGYSFWIGAPASSGDKKGEGESGDGNKGDGKKGDDGGNDGDGNGDGQGTNPPPPEPPDPPKPPDPNPDPDPDPQDPPSVAPNPAVNPYVGDWVAMGWGWEIRFKSSQIGGVTSAKNLMTLTVRHLTRMDFTVDKAGNIRGDGEITYDLDPNLCGVAALTRQVNEAINMMAQLPDYMQAGQKLAKQADEYFNARNMVEESQLKGWMDQWVDFASPTKNGNSMQRKPVLNQKWVDANNYKADDVTDLAKAIWQDRCTTGAPVILAGGLTCDDLRKGPFGGTFKKVSSYQVNSETFWDKAADWLYKKAEKQVKKVVKKGLKDKAKKQFSQFAAAEAPGKAACAGDATLRAGTSEGGIDAKSGAQLAFGTAMTMAGGGLPVGTVMSAPGVTQAQYNYKGLENGPESRSFKIKGHIVGDKMFLEMDGDVYDGDKELVVQYQVNYKTEKKKFPTWSPFEADGAGADLFRQGYMRILERKVTYTEQDDPKSCTEKNGVKTCKKIKIPHEANIAKDSYSKTPFAIMHKTGEHRNHTKVWHEYEYFLHAHKVTSPLPAEGR